MPALLHAPERASVRNSLGKPVDTRNFIDLDIGVSVGDGPHEWQDRLGPSHLRMPCILRA